MPSPRFTLDRSSPVPLYFQVAEQLERAIVSGEIGAGERLENEITMAQTYPRQYWTSQCGFSCLPC